jgi:hypothetical protein
MAHPYTYIHTYTHTHTHMHTCEHTHTHTHMHTHTYTHSVEGGNHDTPNYHVSQARKVNTVQLLGACRVQKQLKQASKSRIAKHILLLDNIIIFFKIIT